MDTAAPDVTDTAWGHKYFSLMYPDKLDDSHLSRISRAPGNVHSADGWDGTLKPVVVRYQANVSRIYFRADAAFAMPEVWRIPV